MTSGDRSDPPLSHTLHSLHWHLTLNGQYRGSDPSTIRPRSRTKFLNSQEKSPSYCILNLKWPADIGQIHPCLTRYRGSDPQIRTYILSQILKAARNRPCFIFALKWSVETGQIHPYILTYLHIDPKMSSKEGSDPSYILKQPGPVPQLY